MTDTDTDTDTRHDEIITTEVGEYVEAPDGSISRFAVGDAVRVTAMVAFLDDQTDEFVERANEELGGQAGEVLAAVYLVDDDVFAYHVRLPVGRVAITPAGLTLNNVWPLLEKELEAVAE